MKCLRGAIIFNRYYQDAGQAHMKECLKASFKPYGIELIDQFPVATTNINQLAPQIDFTLFFDKDYQLAHHLETKGIKVFNNSFAICTCDDKRRTYDLIAKKLPKISLIPTIYAPLKYTSDNTPDNDFLDFVEKSLGYPIIIKQNTGSLGGQVHLIKNRQELNKTHITLAITPHQYQKFIDTGGTDIRVFLVGGEAVALFTRCNPNSFISNVAGSSDTTVKLKEGSDTLKSLAKQIAKAIKLDFGAIDFLEHDNNYYFLEANTGAYFKSLESLGINIADRIAEYVCKLLNSEQRTMKVE